MRTVAAGPGTSTPEPRSPPPGAYANNDGQWVWADDARAIADALERAMPNLKRRRWASRRTLTYWQRWFFTKKGRIAIQETLDFCRKGAFRIY